MRLFVAVELPEPVAAAAAAISADLRQRVERQAPNARLTWVAGDRMHVTVRFIGEVDDSQGQAIASVLGDPLQSVAFLLRLGRAGAFPPRGAPRVIWLDFAEGLDSLQRVEQEVSARLAHVGLPGEAKPFAAHITLARVRDPKGLRAGWLEAVRIPPNAAGTVGAITLFESRLSSKGPTYTALQRTPLRRA